MDRTKEKICHSLQSKVEKHIRSLRKLSESKSFGEKTDSRFDLNINNCFYCPKIFCTSQFLLKHILRRHSDDLVVLYKKMFDITKTDVNFSVTAKNDLLKFISNEFLELRKDLQLMKYPTTCCKEDGQNLHSCTYTSNSNNQSINKKEDAKDADQLINELHDLKAKVFKTETMVQNMELQLRDGATSVEAPNDNDIKESYIYKNLQDSLVMEIQSIMSEIHDENESILRKHIFNFHQEIERLDYLIKSNSDNIQNSKFFQEIEKKLENEIQFFLNCNKARKEKITGKKYQQSIARKIAKKHKQTVDSIHNFSSTSTLSNHNDHKTTKDIHKSSKTENLKKSSEFQCPSIKNATCLIETSKICENRPIVVSTFKSSDAHCKENDSYKEISCLVESDSSKVSNPGFHHILYKLKQDDKAVSLLLDEKLKSLGIPHGSEKLSCCDLETKMRLLQVETEVLIKEYPSFNETRQRLNSYVDNMIFLKKKGKKLKEISFPSSLKQVYPLKEQENQCSKTDSFKKVTFQTNLSPNELANDEYTDKTFTKKSMHEGNISVSNKVGEQVLTDNKSTVKNSAASLKLIKCTNKTLRKLPNFPLELDEELSLCSSLFDSENEF